MQVSWQALGRPAGQIRWPTTARGDSVYRVSDITRVMEAILIGNAAAAIQGAPVTTVDFDPGENDA